MKSIQRSLLVVLLSLSISLFLINCGGSGDGSGGSGGGISYEGETSQVQIDEGNANNVATSAYENGNAMQSMQGAGGIFSAVSASGNGQISTPYGVALARFVKDFLEQADLSEGSGNPSMAVVSYNESMPGECGGSATISGTVNETTGSFNVTVTFSSFCTSEDVSSGNITASGTIIMVGTFGTDSLQANMTLRNFEFTSSDTGESATASGTMSMTMSGNTMNITLTLVMKNNTIDKTYKVENLVISSNGLSGFSMSGRFYDPDYGYVDIETTVAFEMNYGSDKPTSGTMVITGKSNTKARFVVINSTQYQVEADTTGDDTYNYDSGALTW